MKDRKIKSYPSALTEVENGVIVSRGVLKFKIVGCDSYQTLQKIIRLTTESIDENQLTSQFSPISTSEIESLIKMLIDRNILYYPDAEESNVTENEEDIFYWQFNTLAPTRNDVKDKNILIIGINAISTHLVNSLNLSGFNQISLLDDPMLRNSNFGFENNKFVIHDLDSFLKTNIDNYDCVIATTDFNTKSRLKFWNKICLNNNWSYLPLSLNNIHGILGPYVIPGETPCYECFISRENSNLASLEFTQIDIYEASPKVNTNGFHPAMPLILAGLVGLEVTKIFSCLPCVNAGSFIDINFITQEMRSRKVLRIPFCKVCS